MNSFSGGPVGPGRSTAVSRDGDRPDSPRAIPVFRQAVPLFEVVRTREGRALLATSVFRCLRFERRLGKSGTVFT